MTVSAANTAMSHTMKLVKRSLSLFFGGFKSSKCKTAAKMAVARIKLLKNKREVVVKQMRRDIALLLQSKQDANARIRVEHVIQEQNVLAANEFIELFCELIVARLSIIAKQRECPADLKEGIASVIFAAPRCSEIPELVAIRDIFAKKYGEDFVSAATDLWPNSGVNRLLIEKLSVRTPPGEVKLKEMKEIAKEYQIDWDTTESEMELLKPPEEHIEGPKTFVSATSLPVKHVPAQSVEPSKTNNISASNRDSGGAMQFGDTASAAIAAAESAKQAIAAAQAAAYLANQDSKLFTQASGFDEIPNALNNCGSASFSISENEGGKVHRRYSYNAPSANSGVKFNELNCNEENKMEESSCGKVYRRYIYNAPSAHSDIKWDESNCDEEIEMEEPPAHAYLPPERSPPPVPSSLGKQGSVHSVHPKLPDYDDLAAPFDALNYRKS